MTAPRSVQFSFVVNHVSGHHVGEQAVVASVQGYRFLLRPRASLGRLRSYDAGFTLFLAPQRAIRLSLGIVSPESAATGYLHCVLQYAVPRPTRATHRDVTLSPGAPLVRAGRRAVGARGAYSVSLAVFCAPACARGPLPGPPACAAPEEDSAESLDGG
jgi:hypothetical protein